jgi:UDP-N-acetylmuramate--alanine ligase
MIELKDIQRIYFIGIGGIGMSAIARYFISRGIVVSGYDRTATLLAKQLEAEGMLIHYSDEISKLDKAADLVVFTPAVPKEHVELNWYRNNGYEVVKRSDVLQIITKDSFNICIAGTHGKTSISTMTGHILRETGYGCNAFLGGISVNYNTNFWGSENNVCVVEADEYDRSFLKLDPDVAVVTAMDADHLDIYGTVEAMNQAFVEFAGRVKSNGILIRKHGLTKLNEAQVRRQLTYQLHADAAHYHTHDDSAEALNDHDHLDDEQDRPDIYAFNVQTQAGGYKFDASISQTIIQDIELNIGGTHNIENALAAISIATALKIDIEKIKAAVANYKSVKRRFEYIIKQLTPVDEKPLVFIDDYAHHPEELKALISSALQLFPGMRCTVVFQPHLFTRTRDLAEGFATALDMAHEVIVLPIYPARELPIEGVTSEIITSKMKKAQVSIQSKEAYLENIDVKSIELLITAGAGDIDTLVPQLAKKLNTTNG